MRPARPLPPVFFWLSIFSLALCAAAFAVSMVYFGFLTLWMTIIAAFLTVVHHIVIFALSFKRGGPPPKAAPTAAIRDQNISDGSISIVASSADSGRNLPRSNHPQSSDVEEYGATVAPYPSFLISVANCTILGIVAIFWSGFPWLAVFIAVVAYEGWPVDRRPYEVIGIAETTLGYLEALVMWTLFALCVHHRRLYLKRNEFIRMDG